MLGISYGKRLEKVYAGGAPGPRDGSRSASGHQPVVVARRLGHGLFAQLVEEQPAEIVVLPADEIPPPLFRVEPHDGEMDALLQGILDQHGAVGVHRLFGASQTDGEIAKL